MPIPAYVVLYFTLGLLYSIAAVRRENELGTKATVWDIVMYIVIWPFYFVGVLILKIFYYLGT